MREKRALTVASLALGALLGCSRGGGSSASSSPANVLEEAVAFDAPSAGSAQVLSTAPGEQLATPWYPVAAGHGSITVLGLRARTTYVHTVAFVATAGATPVTLASISAKTAALPSELAAMTCTISPVTSSPAPGYFLVSGAGNPLAGGSENYQLAFDQAGTLRWYARFDPGTVECKMQYDGSMTAFVGTSQGWQPVQGEYVRFTPQGTTLATYTASPDTTEPGDPPVYTDPHELLVTHDPSGSEHLHYAGYELRGGAAWHEILRTAPDGSVEFRWKTWDHFVASDETETVPGATDVTHANSLEIDPRDGDYILSLRDMDAVAKVDSTTGALVWVLGGTHNQFTIVGDPLGGFSGQHSVRILPNGDLLMYDDGLKHAPPESRAVEYALDTSAMTATLVWEYRHAPVVFTPYVGSVERLADGDTLVAFSLQGLFMEVDPSGNEVWQGQADRLVNTPLFAYRIRRLPSLYALETP